jgi:virginiamycin B lyase
MNLSRFIATVLLILAFSYVSLAQYSAGTVTEFPVAYPGLSTARSHHGSIGPMGSTHEITFNEKGGKDIWITGQNYDYVVKVPLDGGKMTFFPMPKGSGPHGIEFDGEGKLWVTLEFLGKVVRLDDAGNIVQSYDVNINCPTCSETLITHPHGMGFAPDGKTIWYTGKSTGTIGRIDQYQRVTTFPLKTAGSVPIYIRAGPDGNMWVTELVGNAIARVTQDGMVTEFPIPTHNSRPIAIVPDPDGRGMWFTEEAGNNVAFIDKDGKITEFAVPKKQANVILAGLAFDREKNLWVQQYVDHFNPLPKGTDYIVKIDKSILKAAPADMAKVPVTFYPVQTPDSVFHRIIQGPDGNMWFTEMNANKVGKLLTVLMKP